MQKRTTGPTNTGADPVHMRAINLDRVLAAVMEQPGTFTRAELQQLTGLSAPTVGSLTARLIRAGLVTDLGAGPSRGGRRPAAMAFNARHGVVAALDVGPTRTRLALADLRGHALAQRVVDTPVEPRPSALLARFAAEIRSLLKGAGTPAASLILIGAGAPGAVDSGRGMVVALAPNLEGWSRVPMATTLSRALGAPVVVENDVNLAILGERWRGAAKGHDTCAYISVGTGIGAGVVISGELHRGHHFLAGEIGLMCMAPQYAETDFGTRGCLETLAGRKSVEARWVSVAGNNAAPLLEAARAGDGRARAILAETATLVGMAAANLCSVIDPSIVVLGGPLFREASYLVEDVRRIVAGIIPTPARIVPSALAEEAPMWGALLVAASEARERLRVQLRREAAAS